MRRSKRNPAVKCKVLPVESSQRHLPHVVPLGCTLGCVPCRPLPDIIFIVALETAMSELIAGVSVAEV